jgi:hypothetical protein
LEYGLTLFGHKRDEVTVEWRRLHNKELYAVYSSPDIIMVIKSRRLKWARSVARMGESRGAYRALAVAKTQKLLNCSKASAVELWTSLGNITSQTHEETDAVQLNPFY